MLWKNILPHFFYVILSIILLKGCTGEDIPQQTLASVEQPAKEVADETELIFDFYTPSSSTYADSLLKEANNYVTDAIYDSAMVLAHEAEGIYAELDFKEGLIRSRNIQADALRRQGSLNEAWPVIENTLEDGINWLGEEHIVVADTYNIGGAASSDIAKTQEALLSYQKALAIRKRVLGDTHPLVGRSINNIGITYADLGDFDTALQYYHQALTIRKAALGEVHRDVAQDYNNIAVALKNKGDYAQSLIYHDRALDIRKNVFGELHPEVGASYYNIGVTYGQNGKFSEALENHEKALDIFKKVFSKKHPLIGITYSALSIDNKGVEEYDAALEYAMLALEHNKAIGNKNRRRIAIAYSSVGDIFLSMKAYSQSLEAYNKSLQIYKEAYGDLHPQLASIYQGLADLYKRMGDYELALHHIDLGLQVNHLKFEVFDQNKTIHIEDYSSEFRLLVALHLRAIILESLYSDKKEEKKLSEAFRTYELALDVINQHRSSFKGVGSKLLLAEQYSEIYSDAVQVTLLLFEMTQEEAYLNQAFQIAEKGKALVLLDAINETGARQYSGIPDSLLQKEKELRILLSHYDGKIKNANQQGSNQQNLSILKEEFFTANENYTSLLKGFEQSYPKYYNLKHALDIGTIEDVQNRLLSENEALLEYVVGNDSLFVFLISKNEKYVQTVSIDSTFDQNVSLFKQGIIERNRSLYFPSAYELYLTLVAPVQEKLTSIEQLVIVPDGILNGIPFEALVSESLAINSTYHKAPFLIRDYTIRYTYSASFELAQRTLQNIQNLADQDRPAKEKKDFVGFAPVFESGFTNRVRGQEIADNLKPDSVDGREWGYIPNSQSEIQTISAKFKKKSSLWTRLLDRSSSVFLREDANEQALKAMDLSQYRFIHFATHGLLNETLPELSGIILSQDSSSSEDGILQLGEIYNLDLDADLVVLSACQTGIGKLSKGEGLMSLTRGFMYAGADAILATLWQINDGVAKDIMIDFYDNLLLDYNAATAIREAKLDLINNEPGLALPYYWASFVLTGDYDLVSVDV